MAETEDDFFDIKRYLGKWTPEFYFAELGDTDNFFIHLEYFVNKSRYVSTKSEIGSALDFNMVDGDGIGVFDDLPASTRSILQKRNYKLAFISDGKPQNPDGDLFLVSEVYTYAPTKKYVDYESDIVPIWGLHADFDVSSKVVFSRRNVVDSEYYHNTVLQVDNIGIFQTGDYVDVYVTNMFIQKQHFGPGSPYIYTAHTYEESAIRSKSLPMIIKINKNLGTIELDENIVFSNSVRSNEWHSHQYANAGYNNYDGSNNNYIGCTLCYKNKIKGIGSGVDPAADLLARPMSVRIVKKYSKREFKRRERPVRITTSFHTTRPSAPDIFIPQRETGEELDVISRETTVSPSQWQRKIEDSEYFQYAEAEITFDKINKIYKMQIKETQAI